MKIALIAPPFIAVPPVDYGGTELFVAHLAEGLDTAGAQVTVYSNGESTVNVERRSIYARSQWPIKMAEEGWIRDLEHTSWAVKDAAHSSDVIHVQTAHALSLSRFTDTPFVLTLHGPHSKQLSELYQHYPNVHYVSISENQSRKESMPRMRTIHHGIDLNEYRLVEDKQCYLSFIGRISPIKGTHLAIEVAKRTGIRLKIAGDVQPRYREYFEAKIRPQIDGQQVEYVGLANLAAKNELLGNSMAMLFPIQWDEPFGLVTVEAMACGTPVLAMPGGSVPEIVRDGVSGYVCRTVATMAKRIADVGKMSPPSIRQYVEENFSIKRMVGEYLSLYEDAVRESQRRKVG